MSIQIDRARCIGCGLCTEVCPGSLLRLDGARKITMPRPQDCWGCTACLKECPAGALRYFLGADVGGRGSTMTVREQNGVSLWQITRPGGETIVIEVSKKESNKY